MITLLLPVSHVTVSGWQHMALLCNSADKEGSNHSSALMKCDLLCAGFSLTHTCWFASPPPPSFFFLSLKWAEVRSPRCRTLESPFGVFLPPSLPPSLLFLSLPQYARLLYMWLWCCFRNPVQMFSILVQSLLCFEIAAERGLWWEEAFGKGGEGKGWARQTADKIVHPKHCNTKKSRVQIREGKVR